MATFNPMYHYDVFARDVVRSFRYSYSSDTVNFLTAVCESSDWRKVSWPKGTIFWRSQKGCLDNPSGDSTRGPSVPYEAERMIPRKTQAKEGRVNPKGIPCLYFATDRETSIARSATPDANVCNGCDI